MKREGEVNKMVYSGGSMEGTGYGDFKGKKERRENGGLAYFVDLAVFGDGFVVWFLGEVFF